MLGLCRYVTCNSELGSEYRYRADNKPGYTLLCSEHERIVRRALEDPDPSLRVIVSPERWVYLSFGLEDIAALRNR